MKQDLPEGARELEEALDGVAAVAGWAAVDSVWVENASARIAVIEQLTKEVPPAMRLTALNAVHQ